MACLKCGREVSFLSGIVCANFGHSRGSGRACKGAWHGNCYQQHPDDKFPVLSPTDLEDAILDPEDWGDKEEDPDRFRRARDGDYLLCPFQCDGCVFFNVKKYHPPDTPSRNARDELLMICIRRIILDSFWARESSTVAKNLLDAKRFVEQSKQLGVGDPLPARNPFPIGDHSGFLVAATFCCTLSILDGTQPMSSLRRFGRSDP